MTPDEYKQFLGDLKPGDTVTEIYERKFSAHVRVRNLVIVRLTQTQFVAGATTSELESRFYTNDGYKVGIHSIGSHARGRIYPPDAPEVAEAHEKNKRLDIARQLDGVYWEELPLESLRQILDIVRETK